MTQIFSTKNKVMMAVLILTAAALLTAAFGVFANAPVQAADEDAAPKKTINVSGQSKVSASPDFATINLGVVTEGKDAKAAQEANAKSMDKVISSIKALGISKDDIITVNYSINPKYDYNKESGISSIVGYTVNNSVNVTVRDIDLTGRVIDAAADSGVNTSSSISFGLSNYEDYYNTALKNAVLAAKKKANTMADALGVKLKAPITVNEGGSYYPITNYAVYDMKAEGINAATPIQAGSIEITASVSIVYEY